MAFFDLPLEQLQTYTPPRTEPADFDAFWARTLAEARQFPLNPQFVDVTAQYGMSSIDLFDLTYSGYGGQRIKGWLLIPKNRAVERLPCVVEYIGYGGGRGYPFNWLHWPALGYASLIMDTRGQGSAWGRRGDTPDNEPDGGNPQFPGFMTRGSQPGHLLLSPCIPGCSTRGGSGSELSADRSGSHRSNWGQSGWRHYDRPAGASAASLRQSCRMCPFCAVIGGRPS